VEDGWQRGPNPLLIIKEEILEGYGKRRSGSMRRLKSRQRTSSELNDRGNPIFTNSFFENKIIIQF
jgi:hypothetical protein